MSIRNSCSRILCRAAESGPAQKFHESYREVVESVRASVGEARTAAWHFRQGGLPQLKLWRWKQAAQREHTPQREELPPHGLTRDYPALREAWTENNRRAQGFSPASATRSYRNSFAQGWVLAPEKSVPESPSTWLNRDFGGLRFLSDPDLKVQHKGAAETEYELLLLGHAADSERRLGNSRKVAAFLLKELQKCNDTWSPLDQAVMWLGGRFIVIARRGSELRVHVDAMASRSCYWGETDGGEVILASHSTLVGKAVGDLSATKAKWVLNHPDYHNPAGVYLPGTITPADRARLVFANCCLTITAGEAEHSRFFPPVGEDVIPQLSVEQATEEYLAEVRFQMDALLSQNPHSVLALTAGSDSKAILHATIDLLHSAQTTAMTYHFFERNAEHTHQDLLGANRLAEKMGMQHRLLDVQPWDPRSRFAKLYTRTFPVWARFGALARTCYEGLSTAESLIIGVGGEVGTAFYLERDFDSITPAVLAGKFTQDKFQKDPGLIAEFERYMDYTQLQSQYAGGINLLDLFYWEHRMSSWAAYWYSELDFGPTVALPLNSRRVFCAMLALPFEDRVKKSIYATLASWTETPVGEEK